MTSMCIFFQQCGQLCAFAENVSLLSIPSFATLLSTNNSRIFSRASFGVVFAFNRYASAPRCIHLSISSLLFRLLNITILHFSDGASSRMTRRVSNPSIPGIMISRRMTFGSKSVTRVMASSQLFETRVSNPSFSNFSLYMVERSSSSSTMSIFKSSIGIFISD